MKRRKRQAAREQLQADGMSVGALQHAQQYVNDPELASRNWRGPQGEAWADRNPKDLEATDMSWLERYSVTKTYAARDALRSVPRVGRWLELGRSAGAHTEVLNRLGFEELFGFDVCFAPLLLGRFPRVQADAYQLPFASGSFEGMFMSGSLMHCGPNERMLGTVKEIDRVTRRWWFIMELWSTDLRLVSFGDLLPPAWLCPWEKAIPHTMPHWALRYHKVYDLKPNNAGRSAPMCVTLFERIG